MALLGSGQRSCLTEKRPDYKPHVFEGNLWLVTQNRNRVGTGLRHMAISDIGCLDLMDRGVYLHFSLPP